MNGVDRILAAQIAEARQRAEDARALADHFARVAERERQHADVLADLTRGDAVDVDALPEMVSFVVAGRVLASDRGKPRSPAALRADVLSGRFGVPGEGDGPRKDGRGRWTIPRAALLVAAGLESPHAVAEAPRRAVPGAAVARRAPNARGRVRQASRQSLAALSASLAAER